MNIGEDEIMSKYESNNEINEENRYSKNYNSEIIYQNVSSDVLNETSNNILENNKKLAVSDNDYEIKINKDHNNEKSEEEFKKSKYFIDI